MGLKPTLMQASIIQSCLPFPNFLGHVKRCYKYTWTNLMKTYFKPLKTLPSIVAY
jgi:hypothetical protein